MSITLIFYLLHNINDLPIINECLNILQAIGTMGTFSISAIALIYAIKEYHHHKKSERTALLCQYLERYTNDSNIQNITTYILEAAILDEEGKIIGYNKDYNKKQRLSSCTYNQRKRNVYAFF